jgi:hypothetical protein
MKRLLTVLAVGLGFWILASFTGVIADPPRVDFWTQSLMWSLLSGLVLAPLYAFASAMTPSTSVSRSVASAEHEEAPSETAEISFADSSSEAPPTRALDLSEMRKAWATHDEEEAVSA